MQRVRKRDQHIGNEMPSLRKEIYEATDSHPGNRRGSPADLAIERASAGVVAEPRLLIDIATQQAGAFHDHP